MDGGSGTYWVERVNDIKEENRNRGFETISPTALPHSSTAAASKKGKKGVLFIYVSFNVTTRC